MDMGYLSEITEEEIPSTWQYQNLMSFECILLITVSCFIRCNIKLNFFEIWNIFSPIRKKLKFKKS